MIQENKCLAPIEQRIEEISQRLKLQTLYELYIRLNEKYNCRLIEKLYRIMDEVNQDRKDCD